jgi:hypothetical protein
VIIPAYNERAEALAATISACLKQNRPIKRIYVVDDGSHEPVVLPEWARHSSQIVLLRLPKNQGVAAARNAAISLSTAPFLACVNTEVLPDPAGWPLAPTIWSATHLSVRVIHARSRTKRIASSLVGACAFRSHASATTLVLRNSPTAMRRFFGDPLSMPSADTMSVSEASKTRTYVNACGRVSGRETHYIAHSRSISIQEDTLELLARKQLRDIRWLSPESGSLVNVYKNVTKWTIVRAGRNVVKGRFYFLPVDFALWAYALWIATKRTVKHTFARR